MHYSRMRTGHSLNVCRSQLPGGGVSAPRGVCLLPGGVSTPGGVCSRGGLLRGGVCSQGGGLLQGGLLQGGGGLLRGGVSQDALRQRPPLWTESQTPVKTLPWPNFVAAGNQ